MADTGDGKAFGGRVDRKRRKRLRANIIGERAKALKPLEKLAGKLEGSIVKMETELEHLYEAIHAASEEGDNARIADVSKKIHACEDRIGTFFERLEIAHREYEEQKALFDKRMDGFDGS